MSEERAQPVKNNRGVWHCSKCNQECYHDGRCGDGPILMCKCNDDDPYDGWLDRR